MLYKNKIYSFTLIELLVVIAIIGILAGLLIPAVTKAVNTAHAASCSSLMKNYGHATFFYTGSYDDYLPDVQTFLEPESCFVQAFGADTVTQDITRCAGDKTTQKLGRLFEYNSKKTGEKILCSIGGNGNNLSNSKSGRSTSGGGTTTSADYVRLNDPQMLQMTTPSRIALWIDFQSTSNNFTASNKDAPFYPAAKPVSSANYLGNFAFRHNGSMNACFMDGHVSPVRINKSLINYGHDLAEGETWYFGGSNNKYPFGPRKANLSFAFDADNPDNPNVTYR